ncbi:tRNA (adenine22-N1)-methyltransferase [Alkalibacillus flavidus]|uniref:tRNA (Adenine22-N1)-methyltransferase n=1 Tax=Alkalibacillus flavidus TaxID=546021 RepID=A0ABV2KS74_9BACI
MKQSVLSQRLTQVKQLIPHDTKVLADIGSDHAQLPCYICLERPSMKAIAGEVNEGPKQAAINQVTQFGLSDQIDVRLGDGLSVIERGEADCITIAGMGGSLISSILTDGQDKLSGDELLILQPNIDANLIRRFAVDNQFVINYETVLQEDGYYYEILVLTKSAQPVNYTERELYLGPLMLQQPNQAFREKWSSVYQNQQDIIQNMKQAKVPNQEKIEQFEQELHWIKEALS